MLQRTSSASIAREYERKARCPPHPRDARVQWQGKEPREEPGSIIVGHDANCCEHGLKPYNTLNIMSCLKLVPREHGHRNMR